MAITDNQLKLNFLKAVIKCTDNPHDKNTVLNENINSVKNINKKTSLLGVKRKDNYCNKLYKDILFENYYEMELSHVHTYQNESNENKKKAISNNVKNKGFIFKCVKCNLFYQNSNEYKIVQTKKVSNGIKIGISCQECKSIIYTQLAL